MSDVARAKEMTEARQRCLKAGHDCGASICLKCAQEINARIRARESLGAVTEAMVEQWADILNEFAAEQTAALRREVLEQAATHADCCVDREEMAALREEHARLREALQRKVSLLKRASQYVPQALYVEIIDEAILYPEGQRAGDGK